MRNGILSLITFQILDKNNCEIFPNFMCLNYLFPVIIQGYKITIFEIVGTLLVIAALIRNNVHQRKVENQKRQMLQDEQMHKAA